MKHKAAIWTIVLTAPLLLAACVFMGASGFGYPATNEILQLRLYRIAAGFVVGSGLACAGVILQALLRNPLAEPYVLGVSSGAGLGAAVAILTGMAAAGVLSMPVSAFVFGSLTLLLVYRLAASGGTPSVYSLILSGVVVSAMASAILMFLVSTASNEGLHSIVWWMLGSLQVTSPGMLGVCAAVTGIALVAAMAMTRELNALTLGREMAHYVGVRTSLAAGAGLFVATLLATTAVSLAGLIGFVGLIVPHAVRGLVGADHRRLMPCTIIAGGVFLALSDAVARSVLYGREIPVGVITALLGGPFFLAILRSRRKSGWIQ